MKGKGIGMAYRLTGTYFAPCTCRVACPCDFGEPEGDDGYCSGAVAFDFKNGEIDGVDVSGVVVGLAADWPKGFISGNGKARLYFDPSTSADQRGALERVLTGQAGGDAAGLARSSRTGSNPGRHRSRSRRPTARRALASARWARQSSIPSETMLAS
jgi:hypothetical protein